MKQKLYTIIKLPIKELIRQKYQVTLEKEEAAAKGYVITQNPSLLFDQIERLRRSCSSHINEVILVEAKKNPKQEEALRHILSHGFTYNHIHYSRFGKSASQGKDGITAFVCDSIFDGLYQITQMDIAVEECVISKYEAQRGLLFSSCTVINNYMPNIVIIGEYTKTLNNQLIKYVSECKKEYEDPKTGEKKSYIAREVEEGFADITLSPFDGCGCHEKDFMKTVSRQLGLDYQAAGVQVRMPFIKGYSVYVPFREILKEWGIDTITDIYGHTHPIDTIDCIWNLSMFKGHSLFQKKYGSEAWTEYQNTIKKYQLQLGISKYSHHIKHINKYTRMNFQYLQCLDLWNPKYINYYEQGRPKEYDILDDSNNGKIIWLAKYTTALYEKILKGDPFYTYRFLGITDTERHKPESKYVEAALINKAMLNDPAVKQFIYRKLKKAIDEAKVGKIYCSGFYHTGIGDMIGYLQYAAGMEPVGCLGAHELYSANLACGSILSFRSPLVDPSEVNRVKNTRSEVTKRWFSHFKDQDIVMFNMYDISAPQQGGADFDGDIFFLCDEPSLLQAKIEKPVILDIADKTTAQPKPYTKENIVEYEMMTRDSRIGEITNTATSIENRYTTDADTQKQYDDQCSLLRIFQGKEIDFLKTGFRWNMNAGLRRHLKQLPYFLLFNYPQKMDTYKKLCEKNQKAAGSEKKLPLNAYHSPSPMNELCDYICTWEKKKILWDTHTYSLDEARRLVLDQSLELSDRKIMRICRRTINDYAIEIKKILQEGSSDDTEQMFFSKTIAEKFRSGLSKELGLNEILTANYVIKTSYNSLSISKAFAWTAYGDYILDNLRKNTATESTISIKEVSSKVPGAREYLGKYYTYKEGDFHVRM